MNEIYMLGAGELFMVFFVMAGPLVNLMKFAKATKGATQNQLNSLSWKTFILVVPITVCLGLFGRELMFNWQIPIPILELTAGLFFVIIAFRLLLQEKEHEEVSGPSAAPVDPLSMSLRVIINPYVCGTLIVLLGSSHSHERTFLIFGIFVFVLALDCLAIKFIRPLTGKVGLITMQILGSVLGVLQAALALTIIYASLKVLLGPS